MAYAGSAKWISLQTRIGPRSETSSPHLTSIRRLQFNTSRVMLHDRPGTSHVCASWKIALIVRSMDHRQNPTPPHTSGLRTSSTGQDHLFAACVGS